MYPGGLVALGVVLLIIGLIVKAASVLFTIGLILVAIGLIWLVVSYFGGRRGSRL